MNRPCLPWIRSCVLAASLLPWVAVADDPAIATDSTADTPPATSDTTSLDEIRRFVSVFRAVQEGYVDPIDDTTLMRAAIRGLLLDLDPHSAYLDADQSRALNEAASGAYAGLGLEVIQQPDRSLLVIAPIDDTPAARAGIRSGDVITAIDGKPIEADGVDAAIDAMRGPVGSQARLTVMRDSSREPLQFTLTRETIRVSSVRTRLLEPGYAYLRIATFQANTGLDLERKLKDTIAQNDAPLKGLVLDLRSNPGGLLNTAVEAADAFLDEGVIVSTRGRLSHSHSEMTAHKGDLLDGAPIAILVDGGTASAAEVLAGALRDHRRALVLGSPTFGKGSVQTVLPLDNGDSIKVTTARYYTPNGTSIQATGIVPDVMLESRLDAYADDDDYLPPTLRERDLPGHLRGDGEDLEPVADPTVIPIQPVARPEELDDSGVREALNLLKGLSVFRDTPPRG
ncbi:S41 family peptidase [Xanthomonadaceae bacterium XH05]|nr:S41 family peptidase [Xanthomonadaceae bacterium XH05]